MDSGGEAHCGRMRWMAEGVGSSVGGQGPESTEARVVGWRSTGGLQFPMVRRRSERILLIWGFDHFLISRVKGLRPDVQSQSDRKP